MDGAQDRRWRDSVGTYSRQRDRAGSGLRRTRRGAQPGNSKDEWRHRGSDPRGSRAEIVVPRVRDNEVLKMKLLARPEGRSLPLILAAAVLMSTSPMATGCSRGDDQPAAAPSTHAQPSAAAAAAPRRPRLRGRSRPRAPRGRRPLTVLLRLPRPLNPVPRPALLLRKSYRNWFRPSRYILTCWWRKFSPDPLIRRRWWKRIGGSSRIPVSPAIN